MKKKQIKIISFIILILILGMAILPSKTIATGEQAELYATHRFSNLLQWGGMNINCIYTIHNKNGVEYPIYCLNRELDGATETFSYKVNIDNLLTDMSIWRTVINGYPYKTLAELGCNTKEEAYLATKQAVYCAIYARDPNTYSAIRWRSRRKNIKCIKTNSKYSKEFFRSKAWFSINNKRK